MIDFADLLPVERVLIKPNIATRKVALRTLARALAEGCEQLTYRDIYFGLEEREAQASTVLDEVPVAIPHCRKIECDRPVGAVLLVEDKNGMIFGEDRVKLFFALLVPLEGHSQALKILQHVVLLMADKERCNAILEQRDPVALHELFQQGFSLVVTP